MFLFANPVGSGLGPPLEALVAELLLAGSIDVVNAFARIIPPDMRFALVARRRR